ncbi:MAG: hypothetical protein WBH31_00755 [Promethearchaeia archaeon]
MTSAISLLNSKFPCQSDRIICIFPLPKKGSKPEVWSLATQTPHFAGLAV